MGKKGKTEGNLGRSLIKDKFGKKNKTSSSMLHTSELQDGQDWNRINFKSITEQTDVDSFLSTAELAGTEFKAEKMNIKFIRPSTTIGVLTEEEQKKIRQAQDCNRNLLRIPRRPPWDRSMSGEELALAERETFLEWRRSLSHLQEKEGITMTPYERNLEFWRQLWRVIERSDVVVQIVDARNPLLFYCEDLSKYVREVGYHKENLLLVNKADFLTEEQREKWGRYFNKVGIKAIFFSAILENELCDIEEEESCTSVCDKETNSELLNVSHETNNSEDLDNAVKQCQQDINHLSIVDQLTDTVTESENSVNSTCDKNLFVTSYVNSAKLLKRKELIDILEHFHSGPRLNPSRVTIGLVGYPNVGKSSTINSLLQEKKVSVSATPGKTKHFQTLYLTDSILLCDCPGLVFPAFVSSKEEMIISGILPIDQMRDHVPPINLLLSLIPRNILEMKYGVKILPPLESEDPNRHPISEEFIGPYGYRRGFMTSRGIPDHPRSARYVLKDYINGKLLYCHCPPGTSQTDYHEFVVLKEKKTNIEPTPHQKSALRQVKIGETGVTEKQFLDAVTKTETLSGKSTGSGIKGRQALMTNEDSATIQKPWREMQKKKRNSKQKARNKFAHLDQ